MNRLEIVSKLENDIQELVDNVSPYLYRLSIISVIEDKDGRIGVGELHLTVGYELLEEIKKNPLKDFAGYDGVKTVISVNINATPLYDIGEYYIEGKVENISAVCDSDDLWKKANEAIKAYYTADNDYYYDRYTIVNLE
jgi:hypothetical protein